MYQDPNRCIGRTECMLQEAERLLAEGKNVIIYCLPFQMQIFEKWLNHHDNLILRRHYLSPGFPLVDRDMPVVELFDHAFISQHFGAWLREFHRFDKVES